MADTKTEIVKLTPIVVEKNDVSIATDTFKIVKGDKKDKTYPAIPVTPENFNDFLKWFGMGNAASVLQTFVKQACQRAYFDAVDKLSGVFNETKFVLDLKNLASAGMKLKDIRDKIAEITENQAALFQEAIKNLENGQIASRYVEPMNKLNEEFLAYKAMEEARERTPKDEEAEPSVPVA